MVEETFYFSMVATYNNINNEINLLVIYVDSELDKKLSCR